MRRLTAALGAALATLIVAGCGPGVGSGSNNATVDVTGAFGSQKIGTATQKDIPNAETVMALTQHSFKVSTRYGGGFVQSISGHAGAGRDDWFYYVNGILAPKGAGLTDVHKGDQVWWDLHDWTANDQVPAVVGSYPEPFTSGSGGRSFPTVLDCSSDVQKACDTVADQLKKIGVKVGIQGLGTGSGQDSLSVVVGTWKDLRGIIATEILQSGPTVSGVYAQYVGASGAAIELDNPKGKVVRTVYGDTGMIAATQQQSATPTWVIAGDDLAGVEDAARSLNKKALHDHFAVVVAGSKVIPVPVSPGQ